MNPCDVALIGTAGYGSMHLANLLRLQAAGRLRIAGLCDTRPRPEVLRQVPTASMHTDVEELLAQVRPDVVVIATPPHSHGTIAAAALRAGSHVLLEKPPTASLADHDQLQELQIRTGRIVQVGFQSLGSEALAHARQQIDDGAIGVLEGFGGAGSCIRDQAYFNRSVWAGRRTLDELAVVDGALTNPFAHATATALRLDGSDERGDLSEVTVELFRANDIESDDTSCLALRTHRGTRIVVAATLCASQDRQPYVVAIGSEGTLRLEYRTHRLELHRGTTVTRSEHGNVDLLENLLDHLGDPSVELLSPLARSGAFMEVLEAVRTAPDPTRLEEHHLTRHQGEGGEHRQVNGVDEAVRRSAAELATFSELGLPWATPPRPAMTRSGQS